MEKGKKMKKYYTTEDLTNGNVAVKFKNDEDRLTEILKAAFPKDEYWNSSNNMSGVEVNEKFYLDWDASKQEGKPSFWWATNIEPIYNFPTVSEKYVLLPGEKVSEKGLTWESLLDEYYASKDHGPFSEYLKRNFKCNVKRL